MTATEEFPILASLAISPNLQALLEFDDRLRTPSESLERPGAAPVDLTQPTQYPVRRQQEVPTISLPPPRRKKSVVTGVPMTPKTSYECHRAPSPTDTFPGAGEFGGPGEIMFARVEDTLDEMEFGPANPYLNTPPSPPRYFYPRSDDEEDGFDRPSPFYTLEKSRFTRRPIRKRSFGGDQQASLTERKGGRPVSPLYFTTLGCNVGPRPVEKGQFFFLSPPFFFFSISVSVFQSVGATCGTDETAALAQLDILLAFSPGAFECFSSTEALIWLLDWDVLRTIIFSRTTNIHLEVYFLFR